MHVYIYRRPLICTLGKQCMYVGGGLYLTFMLAGGLVMFPKWQAASVLYYDVYMNESVRSVMTFPTMRAPRPIPECYGHHAITEFAIVTIYTPSHGGVICKLSKSIRHFMTNVDLLFITSHASNDARECGWGQCLLSMSDKFVSTSPTNPYFSHIKLLAAYYNRILFLDGHQALPIRQFAHLFTDGLPPLAAAEGRQTKGEGGAIIFESSSTRKYYYSYYYFHEEEEDKKCIILFGGLKPSNPWSCWKYAAEHICLLWSWI